MEPLSALLFLTFLLLLLKLTFTALKPQNDPKLPPGPPQLPIIGSINHLLRSLPHHRLRDLSKTYGPVLHLKLGQTSLVVASSAEAAKEFTMTHDLNFASRPLFDSLNIVTYERRTVSVAPHGEYWRQMRKVCMAELLSAGRVHSYRSIRVEEVQSLVRFLSAAKRGSVVNLSERLNITANNIATRAVIGCQYDDQTGFVQAIYEGLESIAGFTLADLYPSLSGLLGVITGSKRRAQKFHTKIDRILENIIRVHVEEKRSNHQQVGEDFVDALLRLQAEGSLQCELTNACIKAVTLDMLAGGSETVGTVMIWAMSELVRNPRVMERAQLEAREGLKGTEPAADLTTGLPYLQSVIKETLRLHPPAPLLLPRECRKECQVLGYTIPEKSRVVINVWAMGRDPSYWEDAEEFKPERFEGSPTDFKGTCFEFLPFGAGRRMCPGMSFGMANVELTLAQLLYRFDWELPEGTRPGDVDMSESFGLGSHRTSDLYLYAIPYVDPPPPLLLP